MEKNNFKKDADENNIITCADFDKREGWHIMNIKTYLPFSNEIQSYFAGYIEGYIYHELIGYHHTNIYKTVFHDKELPNELNVFMKKQEEFVRRLINEKIDQSLGNFTQI